MKTYQEAKAALAAAGYVGEPTPEAIAAAGWDPLDTIKEAAAIGSLPATVSEEQFKRDAAALMEEAKSNSLPANILGALGNVLGFVKTAGLL